MSALNTGSVQGSSIQSTEDGTVGPRSTCSWDIMIVTGGAADGAARVLSMLMQRAYDVQQFTFELADEGPTVVRCRVGARPDGVALLVHRLRQLVLVLRAGQAA